MSYIMINHALMRCFFLPLLLCLVLKTTASPVSTFDKLADVNKCWKEQADLDELILLPYSERTDEAWIKLHLTLVEKKLRSRDCKSLNPQQRKNRLACLDHLHSYMLAGRFPQNEDYTYRTPIFIDKYDNFCAVGYLIKVSGYEKLSRMIQSKTNLAYVRQMKYPELLDWANEHGFTVDELAWIQPTYSPKCSLKPVGKGLQGEVLELFPDSAGQKLYAGGSFITADSSITVNNIAYVTQSGGVYTWHAMGSGINGNVYAIAKYNGNIFVAGGFSSAGGSAVSNIAYWDGAAWHAAGCLDGLVKDLVVFNGNLYAAGDFDLCNSTGEVNFAKWNGTVWQGITGLSGRVNTMEVKDTFLFLGGAFSYNAMQVNAIKWSSNTGFQNFGNVIRNEVNDFELFYDTMRVVCKFTAANDTSLFKRLLGNTWDSTHGNYFNSYGALSFNTLCAFEDTFTLGGNFYSYPQSIGTYEANTFDVTPQYYSYAFDNNFMTDSAVNKLVVFNNAMYAGGKFTQGIGVRKSPYPTPGPFSISVNNSPSCKGGANGYAAVSPHWGSAPYTYLWSAGQTGSSVNNLSPGSYTVVGIDRKGKKDTVTFAVTTFYFDSTLAKAGNTLTTLFSSPYPMTYQWVNCDSNYAPIAGETTANFTAQKDGNYAVIITVAGSCSDTSLCYTISMNGNPSGINTGNYSEGVKIYPNPAHDVLAITLRNNTGVQFRVCDVTGRILLQGNAVATKQLKLDVRSLSPGMYTLVLSDELGYMQTMKFVKQ